MGLQVSVTEKMVEAAEKALSDMDSGLWTRGGSSYTELFTAIYKAMYMAKFTPD